MQYIKNCINCGKVFFTHKDDQKFCCRDCVRAYHKEHSETWKPKKQYVCAYCGKEFSVSIKRGRKFCSDECARQMYKKEHGTVKVCERCGKEFLTIYPKQRFCSRKCAYASKQVRKIKRICEICGREFETIRTTQKYCSRECVWKGKRGKTNTLAGECIRCSRPRAPGSSLCEYHIKLTERRTRNGKD